MMIIFVVWWIDGWLGEFKWTTNNTLLESSSSSSPDRIWEWESINGLGREDLISDHGLGRFIIRAASEEEEEEELNPS